MKDARECEACGRVGLDVSPKVVELPEPWTTGADGLPIRFEVQPRCADKYACQERQERAS